MSIQNLKILEIFSQVYSDFEILNNDEYIYIAGSMLIVRSFKTSGTRYFKFLESESSGFSSFAYNNQTNLLVTVEGGLDTVFNIYYYCKDANNETIKASIDSENFENESNRSCFIKISSFVVEQSLTCCSIDINRDGSLIACLFNDPLFELRVYDISYISNLIKSKLKLSSPVVNILNNINNNVVSGTNSITSMNELENKGILLNLINELNLQEDNKIKEVIKIKNKFNYKKVSFNPLNSLSYSSLVMFSNTCISYVEILDAFPKNYHTKFMEDIGENTNNNLIDIEKQIRIAEEYEIGKRYNIYHKKANFSDFEFIDFAWDTFFSSNQISSEANTTVFNSNIYVACSSREIYLLDSELKSISVSYKSEQIECIKVFENIQNIIMTQRYLLCSTEDNKIIYFNPFIPSSEFNYYKAALGGEDYKVFSDEKTVGVSNLGNTLCLKLDNKFLKLYAATKEGNFYMIPIYNECLIRDTRDAKDKDDIPEYITNFNNNNDLGSLSDVKPIEENSAHVYEIENPKSLDNFLNNIVGIKQIPETSVILSIDGDQKICFWDLYKRSLISYENLDYEVSSFDLFNNGDMIVVGSILGVLRIYKILSNYKLSLIYQTRFLTKEGLTSIDRIKIDNNNKYIAFCCLNDNLIYFISAETTHKFSFFGFIQTPLYILDIDLVTNKNNNYLILLSKQVLISYSIRPDLFIIDQKDAIKVSNRKNYNILNNFELKFDLKARKIDSDLNFIVKSINTENVEFIWTVGDDRYFRLYKLPSENFESIINSKKSPDKPLEEERAQELKITDAYFYGDSIISSSDDGYVQITANKKVLLNLRSHNFLKSGISCLYVNIDSGYIYVGGEDGSIFILGMKSTSELPSNIEFKRNDNNDDFEFNEYVEFTNDLDLKSFEEACYMDYIKQIKSSKKNYQGPVKEKLENIKNELIKYINDNKKENELEQLKPEEMIIDYNRIEVEKKIGEELENALSKELFYELSERELYKEKLNKLTFEIMTVKTQNDTIINNNLVVYSNILQDKQLKSYALRTFSEKEKQSIYNAKQLRIIELQEKYKKKDLGINEIIDESTFTNTNEDYLVNRISAQIELEETEINPNDINDGIGEGYRDDKNKFKAAKYKLQKDPYENFGIKYSKQDENAEAIKYKPEEILLKEDLAVKYKTIVNPTTEIDISKGYIDIDTFSLLYSPFELYTEFRMRTQIFLILDIIQKLKINFNNELNTFYSARTQSINKFNQFKSNLQESLSDVIPDNIDKEYSIKESEFADNNWVNKFDESEIKMPRYLSKEEKEVEEKERLRREEWNKALKGDTLETRGLKKMIAEDQQNKKENSIDNDLPVKEPWMNNDINKFTEDEMNKYNLYAKKLKDYNDKIEKIKAQKITKMNNIFMDMDNLKVEMESKYLKILKKKLYYDYKITEQEMYILSLLRIQESRFSIKEKRTYINKLTNDLRKLKENYESIKSKFNNNYNEFINRKANLEFKFNDKNKNKYDELSLFSHGIDEFNETDKERLKEIRLDPIYFYIKRLLKHAKKYGTQKYNEIIKPPQITSDSSLINIKNILNYVSLNLLYYNYNTFCSTIIISKLNLKNI